MGKPKSKTTTILGTKNKLKTSIDSQSQKLKEKKKNKDHIKKAVKNIDHCVKNGEYVRLLPDTTRAKLKASKNRPTQSAVKLLGNDDPVGHAKSKKPRDTITNGVSKKNVKKPMILAIKNEVQPKLTPATQSVKPSTVLINSNSNNSNKTVKNGKRKHGEMRKRCLETNEAKPVEKEKCELSKTEAEVYSYPSGVERSTVLKAVVALKQLSSTATGKNVLFDDDCPVFLQFTLVKIPNKSVNTAFDLPHSLVTATSEVCLIVPDLSKGFKKDHESTIDSWNDKLQAADVTKVNTVLPFRQLRVEYDQFELKRMLYTQHDFILVDSRLLSHAAHLLGKMFFNSHNKFIPVRIHGKDIKKSIDKALQTALLKVKESATAHIHVAHNEMSLEEIVDNIEAVVNQLKERFPGGEGNIRALHIKLPTTPAVPIYITLKPNSTVNVPKVKTQQPKAFRDVEDELSTYSGEVKVKVMPEGRVLVTKEKLQKRVQEELEDAIHEEENDKKKQKLLRQDDSVEGGDLQDVIEEESDEQETDEDSDEEEEDESDDE